MEERRRNNQQHKHKDKQRNAKPTAKSASSTARQPQSTTNTITPSSQDDFVLDAHFSKRTLTSNWSKYDSTPNSNADDDNLQLSAADFEMLLLAPKSVGSHFVFSNEKSWNAVADEDATAVGDSSLGGHHFRLNLVEFERQMATIPFYIRQDYDASWFSATELADMERSATLAQRPDGTTSTASVSNIQIDANTSKLLALLKEERVSPVVIPPSAEVAIDNTQLVRNVDELDALLDLDISEAVAIVPLPAAMKPTIVSAAPANDIQQWLDDILDD